MTLQQVKQRLAEIERLKDDDETAHILEDNLFYSFVNSIQQGKYKTMQEVVEVANEVMKVKEIEFERWFA